MTTDRITEIEQRGTLASSQMIRSDTPFIALTPSERDELCAEARKVEGLELQVDQYFEVMHTNQHLSAERARLMARIAELKAESEDNYVQGQKKGVIDAGSGALLARADSAEQKLRANQVILEGSSAAIKKLRAERDEAKAKLDQADRVACSAMDRADEAEKERDAAGQPSADAAETAQHYEQCASAADELFRETGGENHQQCAQFFRRMAHKVRGEGAGQPASADERLDRAIDARRDAGLPVAPETDREARHRAADGPRPKASRDALMESPRTFSVRAEIAAALDEMGTLFRDRKFAVMSLSDCFNNVAAKLRQADAR